MNVLNDKNTLLVGIGNSGRSDDGLGWAFTDAIEQNGQFKGDIIQRYQLQVEDAELISNYGKVIFVDACQNSLPEGFELKPCYPSKDFSFTTHELAPETVLYLCEDLYQKMPDAYLLLIEGKDWGLKIGMSAEAEMYLEKALENFAGSAVYAV